MKYHFILFQLLCLSIWINFSTTWIFKHLFRGVFPSTQIKFQHKLMCSYSKSKLTRQITIPVQIKTGSLSVLQWECRIIKHTHIQHNPTISSRLFSPAHHLHRLNISTPPHFHCSTQTMCLPSNVLFSWPVSFWLRDTAKTQFQV